MVLAKQNGAASYVGGQFLGVMLLLLAAPAFGQWGDAQRGAELVQEETCATCHRAPAASRHAVPDLTRPVLPDVTPGAFISTLWNHGPILWRALATRNLSIPEVSEENVVDIYAHFFALRAFDPAGDADRGQDVFTAKNCHRCHALIPADSGIAPPVSLWPSVSNPVAWVENMWNHGIGMREEIEQANGSWPTFEVREMLDLLAFLENAPVFEPHTPDMQLGDPGAGKKVFKEQNCVICHKVGTDEPGKIDLIDAVRAEHTPTALAVAMWNHQPVMFPDGETEWTEAKPFRDSEMNDLIGYLFAEGYFGVPGDTERGERLFEEKGCAHCHVEGVADAPLLPHPDNVYSVAALGAAFWKHAPVMRRDMLDRNLDWPDMTPRDASDLLIYLNGE